MSVASFCRICICRYLYIKSFLRKGEASDCHSHEWALPPAAPGCLVTVHPRQQEWSLFLPSDPVWLLMMVVKTRLLFLRAVHGFCAKCFC